MSSDKLISLIAKLKAHEQSARSIGNQAEAEAFAAKVTELLTAHKLTMTEVEYQSQEKSNPLGRTNTHRNGGSAVPQSSIRLAQGIANHTFCKVLLVSGVNQVIFIGREVDRMAATELFQTLEKASWSIARKEWRQHYPGEKFHTGPFAIQWAKSFLTGFSVGVATRLSNQFADQKAQASSEATGLMLREAFALQEYIDNTMKVKPGSGRKDVGTNSDAYYRGKEHGMNANVNKSNQLRLGK